MKTRILFAAILCLFLSGVSSNGQVPQLINYQGRVAVGGTNFDSTGEFKFALVNADGGTTYWSNDGTSTAGGQPVDSVSLPVGKGIYSVLLGDTTIPHMTVVPATVFSNSDVRLRVWFNDGTHDWQQLTPDQRIAAVGYAMMAGNVPDGAITTPNIAAGAVGAAQIANGAVGSEQVAAGAVSAALSVSGNSQDAAANTSYVVTGTTAATFTLPSTAKVGDTVQITGATAGWSVATSWTARASSLCWEAVASSADGTKLAACVSGDQIYTSTDSGTTWTARASSQQWLSVASSADGTKLVACVDGGQIYTSADSGATWIARASSQRWQSVASSADGTKLVACFYPGQIYTSADSGATWTARLSGDQGWSSVASSADGTKLVACVDGGQIYTSVDSRAPWTARASTQNWFSVACSADGTKLAAAVFGGRIYTSRAYSGPQGTTASFRYAGDGSWVRMVPAP